MDFDPYLAFAIDTELVIHLFDNRVNIFFIHIKPKKYQILR